MVMPSPHCEYDLFIWFLTPTDWKQASGLEASVACFANYPYIVDALG